MPPLSFSYYCCRRSHQSRASRHENPPLQIRRSHLRRRQREPSDLPSSDRLLHRLRSLVRTIHSSEAVDEQVEAISQLTRLLSLLCRGLIGPRRQFGSIDTLYHPAFFSFLVGAVLPVPFWFLARKVRLSLGWRIVRVTQSWSDELRSCIPLRPFFSVPSILGQVRRFRRHVQRSDKHSAGYPHQLHKLHDCWLHLS
jgi:hypothetical protein